MLSCKLRILIITSFAVVVSFILITRETRLKGTFILTSLPGLPAIDIIVQISALNNINTDFPHFSPYTETSFYHFASLAFARSNPYYPKRCVVGSVDKSQKPDVTQRYF